MKGSEQHPAVGSDLIGVLPTFLLLFGQAFLFEPCSIPLHPFGWHLGKHPLGRHFREDIQDIDHRLSHAQRPVERADLGQHMRRVGALPPTGFEPSTLATALQEEFQQPQLGIPRNQTRAELGEHGMVKPGVSQFQAEPRISKPADRVRRQPLVGLSSVP